MIKLYSLLVVAVLTLVAAADQSKLVVVKQPTNQVYDFSSALKLSDLPNILLAANGLSIDKTPEWKGLKTTNPLSIPKATLLFLVNSKSLNDSFAKQFIPVDEDTTVDLESLKLKLGSNVVTKSFDGIKNDFKSLEDDCSGAMSSVFYTFKVSDAEAEDLAKSINNIVDKFNNLCVVDQKNDLLVYVLSAHEKHIVRRQAEIVGEKNNTNKILNKAEFYSDQYPAMFNLLFWTTLLLAIAIFGISYGMFNIDPGLDTVIYRMTSQRIKKDQ